VTCAVREEEVAAWDEAWRLEPVWEVEAASELEAEDDDCELALEVDVPVVVEPAAEVDPVPELLAAATPPKATTAAKLARAVPRVNRWRRSMARLRSPGDSRCALVMPEVWWVNLSGRLPVSASRRGALARAVAAQTVSRREAGCQAAWRSMRWRSRAACWSRASVSRSTLRSPPMRSEIWPACHSAAKIESNCW
jgi:hypothetical protein